MISIMIFYDIKTFGIFEVLIQRKGYEREGFGGFPFYVVYHLPNAEHRYYDHDHIVSMHVVGNGILLLNART